MSFKSETTIAEALTPGLAGVWDAFADNPLATSGFLISCRNQPAPGFHSGLIYQLGEGDRLVAGSPYFEHEFRIDMAMPRGLRALGDVLLRLMPGFVRVPILCLGMPLSDRCGLVVDPSLSPSARRQALVALVDRLVEHGHATGAHLVGIKDLPGTVADELHAALTERGFARTAGLPMACLDLPFASEQEYIASLPPKPRSDLRRKIRQSHDVVIARDEDPDAIDVELERLYAGVRRSRNVDFGAFDALPPGLPGELLRTMGSEATLATSRVRGALVGFSIVMSHAGTGAAFKIALDRDEARRHNLYFMNWLWCVRHLIARGDHRLDAGQTTYAVKRRLGCRLEPSWIYFRHRSPAWNRICHLIGPRYSFAQMDPELKTAGYAP